MSPYTLYFLNLYHIFIVFKFTVTCLMFILVLWSIKYLFIYMTVCVQYLLGFYSLYIFTIRYLICNHSALCALWVNYPCLSSPIKSFLRAQSSGLLCHHFSTPLLSPLTQSEPHHSPTIPANP